MARPRGNDWLEDEIKWFHKQNVNIVVSLLENSEIWELGLEKEKYYCEKEDIKFINLPIGDRKLPNSQKEFIELSIKLAQLVKEGKKVSIHCRMGIGRASLLTGAIMIVLGFKAENVFNIIGKYRKLKVPDTETQKTWLLSIENEIKTMCNNV